MDEQDRGARAVTWEEYQQWRRENPDGGPRRVSWPEEYLRDWAADLIKRDIAEGQGQEPVPLSTLFAHEARQQRLHNLFNEISNDPSLEASWHAVQALWSYRFGWRHQAPV